MKTQLLTSLAPNALAHFQPKLPRFLHLLGLCLLLISGSWSSHAQITTYTATLSGAAEDAPNASPGTGAVTVTIDAVGYLPCGYNLPLVA